MSWCPQYGILPKMIETDVNAHNKKRQTLLIAAAIQNKHDIAKALIRMGVDVNWKDIVRLFSSSLSYVLLLTSFFSLLLCIWKQSKTALVYAEDRNNVATADVLRDNGAT
jgi:ankyrin repeat protein